MKIAVFEPYYGGSHKAFLTDLQRYLPYAFALYTLPARKWKWRMRLAAPYFASLVAKGEIDLHGVDKILCSPFLDVAVFKGMLPSQFQRIPVVTYFHENQFAYPVQVTDERDFHFSLTNLTTALASEAIAFNSLYNKESFVAGVQQLLRKAPDMKCADFVDGINSKATVLHPGLDFSEIDRQVECRRMSNKPTYEPIIVWNHRWEHDKNPELFFETLFNLKACGIAFRLIVLGESFQRQPAIFEAAREHLADRILHYGYLESREDYLALLCQSDIVVSTATHEFYGISVIEAVRAGCCPLLPDRLSYRELFADEFRYADTDFEETLIHFLAKRRIAPQTAQAMTERFSWNSLLSRYCAWLGDG